MKFGIHLHFLIEPELFYGLCGIGKAIGLNDDVLDISVVKDVLDSGHEIVSFLIGIYFALQQMQPFGSSKKLLNGTPDSSMIRGC